MSPIVPTRDEVLAFLQSKQHMYGALSYNSDDPSPESITVAFSATPGLSIIFGTSRHSRKYAAIARDPNVSILVADTAARQQVHVAGAAVLIRRHEFTRRFATNHYAKLGGDSLRFEEDPDQRFFLIRARRVRYSDNMSEPWVFTDIELPD
jgi:general stress protein 26